MTAKTTLDTYPSRQVIDLACPDPGSIRIEDIAWGLAKECRYANQIKPHYSVAEHCIHVSHMVPKEYALRGLIHDGAEFLLRDLPKPAKNLCPGYEKIEGLLQSAIYTAFDIDPKDEAAHAVVKTADRRLYSHENLVLRENPGELIPNFRLPCWAVDEARNRFTSRFRELT